MASTIFFFFNLGLKAAGLSQCAVQLEQEMPTLFS